MQKAWGMLKQGVRDFSEDKASSRGRAALAFYAIFALARSC